MSFQRKLESTRLLIPSLAMLEAGVDPNSEAGVTVLFFIVGGTPIQQGVDKLPGGKDKYSTF
jgi:hypothetical protein